MKTYNVTKITGEMTADMWETLPKAMIDVVQHPVPEKPYITSAQLAYNDEKIFVHLKTDERKIRAVNTERNSGVCEDSCMEFFFAPDNDDVRYFNFEINPIGTLLLYVCNKRIEMVPTLDDATIFNIKSVITKDGWELFYEIPFTFITKYFKKVSPTMLANFYKCGEKTAVEHYIAWSKHPESPRDFHRPEDFGQIIFEGK